MLVLSRKVNERIVIDGNIIVTVVRIRGDIVRRRCTQGGHRTPPGGGRRNRAGDHTGRGAAMISKWLNNLALTTAEAYRKDLRTFAEFTGHVDAEACAQAFIRLDNGQANALLLAWKSSMRDAGKSPATINRRLSTLKSLVKRARLLGLTTMCVDVAGERRSAYRDTRGPSMAAIRKILAEAEKRIDAKGLRDLSLLVLMTDLGLRRGEMVSLDREHVDLPGSRLAVMGKGRREREWVTMPSQTQEALAAWLVLRGDHPGALFHNFDRAKKSATDGSGGVRDGEEDLLGDRSSDPTPRVQAFGNCRGHDINQRQPRYGSQVFKACES
jgi:site-specific recombinase XerC